ncbi:hypothetical protein SNE40_018987 [Patella caerulea]|uniref:C2H2-type domain-containing protein n=1 Tax=Patella caerulea TaxID=87958 RepID=A0AAN8P4Z3_PATCE
MSKLEDVNASLLGIQTYLQTQTYEKGTAHNDKRNIRKRSKDFKVENGELYFVQKVLCDSSDNNQKEYQRLRKAILTDKEKMDIISRLHVHENGTHFGIEKTSKAVKVLYYWVGITEYVKRYIRECPECILTRIEQNNLQTPGKKREKRSSKILENSQIAIENYTAQNNTDDTEEEALPEDTDYLEHSPDSDGNDIIAVPVTAVSTPAKGSEKVHFIIKEEIIDYPPELPISYFWELVEFEMFGPFGDSKLYVCVGIDVFSRWTEVKVFERPSVNLLASFILQLICRYGKMKNFHLRENGNREMKSEDVIQIINNSLETDIIYKTSRNEHMDSFWKCVSEELKQNIDKNPNDWMNCLEIFLYPLRFGCSEGAEYSPAFLAHSREPVLIYPPSDRKDATLELRFTTAQQNKSVEKLFNLFKDIKNYSATQPDNQDLNINSQRLSKPVTNLVSDTVVAPITVGPQITPNIAEPEIQPVMTEAENQSIIIEPEDQAVMTEPEDQAVMTEPEIKFQTESLIKTKTQPEMGMSPDDLTLESQPTDESRPSDETTRKTRLCPRKCNRILPESSTKRVEKISTKNRRQTKKETAEGCSSDVPKPDENRRRSLRGVKQDWSSLCGKRKRSVADNEKKTEVEETSNTKKKKRAPAEVVKKKKEEIYESDDDEVDDAIYDEGRDESAEDDNSDNNISDEDQYIRTINSFDADEFYTAVKHYLETKKHKSQSSSSLKSSVCKSLVNFTVENSSLYYQASKKNLRKRIVMDEKERIKLMTEAHIDDEGTHLCKRKVIDCISAMSNYWRGLTLDCEAFVRACPQCSKGMERKTPKPVSMMESKDITEEKDSWYPITYYLKNKTYPPGYSKVQKTSLRRKAQNYFFKDNILFYRFCNKPDSEPRECLFARDEKIKVIKEAHIEDSGNHCGLNRTQEKIKAKYYWVGQTNDIYKYISKCCLEPEKLPSQYMDKKAALDEREQRFKQYFEDEGKNKPVADGTMDTNVNNKTPEKNEIDSSVDCNTSNPLDTEVSTNPSSTSETDLPQITATSSANPFQEETINAIASLNSVQNEASSPEKSPSISTQTNSLESPINSKSTEGGLEKPTVEKTSNAKRQKQGWLQCAVCKTLFSGKVSYKIHMMKHYGVKPYQCDFCEKGFTTMKAKVLHRRKHTGEKPYLCNICGRGFERKSGLRYHLKAHERGGGVRVHCDLCSRSFQTTSRLANHKSCKHPPDQPVFKCIQCHKVFTFKRSLKRHISSAHMKERKFQCELCEKTFARNEYLVKHVANQHNSVAVDSSQVKEEPVNETILEYIDANTLAQLTAQGHVTLEGNIQLINQGDIQELQINGNSHQTHMVISQDSVQYEVECLTSEQNLSIEDQQAIQLLVQASLQSQQPYTTTQQQ